MKQIHRSRNHFKQYAACIFLMCRLFPASALLGQTPEARVTATASDTEKVYVIDLSEDKPVNLAVAKEDAVRKALRWLKENQEENGCWSPEREPNALTGLAILAFLSHGETPSSVEFGETVAKALHWLANDMGARDQPGRGYSHAMATYALSEAYDMTRLPFLKSAMEKGLQIIVAGQQPGGGFDYNYKKGERWDVSVSSWQIQALKSGYLAGAEVPGLEEAMKKSIKFLKEKAYKDGRFGYSSPGKGGPAMDAAGTYCLQLLGEGDSIEAKTCLTNRVASLALKWERAGHSSCYTWYYVNRAMFHGEKKTFVDWHKQFVPMLIANQAEDGHWDDPEKPGTPPHSTPYLSVMATCMNTISLNVGNSRRDRMPTYRTPSLKPQEKDDVFNLDDDE